MSNNSIWHTMVDDRQWEWESGIIDNGEWKTIANGIHWEMKDSKEWHTMRNDTGERHRGMTDNGEWETMANVKQWEIVVIGEWQWGMT